MSAAQAVMAEAMSRERQGRMLLAQMVDLVDLLRDTVEVAEGQRLKFAAMELHF
jgi:hypothetical protein